MRKQQNRKVATKRNDRKGVAVVEMALTLPVLFLLLFACYEFGRANMIRHTVQGAAYEACRVAIVPGATAQEAIDTAQFFLSTVGVNDFNIVVTPTDIDDSTEQVTILITVSMQNNSSIGLLFNENAIFEGRCNLGRETL